MASSSHSSGRNPLVSVLATGGDGARFVLHCGWVNLTQGGSTLFAPESDGFTATGSLIQPRDSQTATVLLDGTVLIAGGVRRSYQIVVEGLPPLLSCERTAVVLSSAELFK